MIYHSQVRVPFFSAAIDAMALQVSALSFSPLPGGPAVLEGAMIHQMWQVPTRGWWCSHPKSLVCECQPWFEKPPSPPHPPIEGPEGQNKQLPPTIQEASRDAYERIMMRITQLENDSLAFGYRIFQIWGLILRGTIICKLQRGAL